MLSSPSRTSWMGMLPAELHGAPHSEGPLLSLMLCYYCLDILKNFGTQDSAFLSCIGPQMWCSWTCYLPRSKVCPLSGFENHRLPKCLITGCVTGGSHSVGFTSTIDLAKQHKSYYCSAHTLRAKLWFQYLSLVKDRTSSENGQEALD